MAKRVTTIKCRIQDDFVDFSIYIYIYIYIEKSTKSSCILHFIVVTRFAI